MGNTVDRTPGVGHGKGMIHYLFGDIKGGNKAMESATSTSMNIMEKTPVLGHIKGLIHYAIDDEEAGDRAMVAATRTTAVMGAGAGGFLLGGPAVAVTLGIGTGAEWDLSAAALTNGRNVNGVAKIIENPKNMHSYIDTGLNLVGDGFTGYSGGKIAERIRHASEIRTAERLQQIRQEKGFPQDARVSDAARSKEVFCEVKDMETGNTYSGVNETVRKAYGDPAPRPNEFLVRNSDVPRPLNRHPASCAENQALHKYVVDNPNSSTLNTRINTLEVRSDGQIYTIPPCDNCKAFEGVVGYTNTDTRPHRVPGSLEYATWGGGAAAAGALLRTKPTKNRES